MALSALLWIYLASTADLSPAVVQIQMCWLFFRFHVNVFVLRLAAVHGAPCYTSGTCIHCYVFCYYRPSNYDDDDKKNKKSNRRTSVFAKFGSVRSRGSKVCIPPIVLAILSVRFMCYKRYLIVLYACFTPLSHYQCRWPPSRTPLVQSYMMHSMRITTAHCSVYRFLSA
mgnify:CR=1 FL=1